MERTLYASTLLYILVPPCRDLEAQVSARYGRRFVFAKDLNNFIKTLPTVDFAHEFLERMQPEMHQRIEEVLERVISVEQFVTDLFEALDTSVYPFPLCESLMTKSNVLRVLDKHDFFQCLDRRKVVASAAQPPPPPFSAPRAQEAEEEPLQFEMEMEKENSSSVSDHDYFTGYMSLWVRLNPPPQLPEGISA